MKKFFNKFIISIATILFAIAPLSVSAGFFSDIFNKNNVGGGPGTINTIPVKTFLGLTDTPSSYSGQATKAVRVNAGATALEFVDFPTSELTLADVSGFSTDGTKSTYTMTSTIPVLFKSSDGNTILTINETDEWVDIDNLRFDGNTISATDMGGNLSLQSNGFSSYIVLLNQTIIGDDTNMIFGTGSDFRLKYNSVSSHLNLGTAFDTAMFSFADTGRLGINTSSPSTVLDMTATSGITIGTGMDSDIALFNVRRMTDTPTFFWDDSETAFAFDNGVRIVDGLVATGNAMELLESAVTYTTTGAVSASTAITSSRATLNFNGSHSYADTNGLGLVAGYNQLNVNSSSSVNAGSSVLGLVTIQAGTNTTLYGTRGYIVGIGSGTTTSAIAGGFGVLNFGANVFTNAYGIKVEDITAGATNYAIYTGSGDVRFGDNVNVVSTTEQLRLSYDASNYLPVTVSSAGIPTFQPTGNSMVFKATSPAYIINVHQSDSTATAYRLGTYADSAEGEYLDNGSIDTVISGRGKSYFGVQNGLGIGVNTSTVNTGRSINAHQTGSGVNYVQFTNDTTAQTTADGIIFGLTAGEEAIFWNYENTSFRMGTNNTEYMRLGTTGNLYLGGAADATHRLESVLSSSSTGVSSSYFLRTIPSGTISSGSSINGTLAQLLVTGSTTISTITATGGNYIAEHDGSSTVHELIGLRGQARTNAASTGVLASAKSILAVAPNNNLSGNTITNAYSLYIESPSAGTTLNYGLYQDGSALNYFGGVVQHNAPVRLKGYTVAGLPAGTIGDVAYITDGTVVPAKGVAPVGGGTADGVVFYDGAAWVGI